MSSYFNTCFNIFNCSTIKDEFEVDTEANKINELNMIYHIQMKDNNLRKNNDNTIIIKSNKIHIDNDFIK